MNRHKWFVTMSAMMVAFLVWVSPAQAKTVNCCVIDPPACCDYDPLPLGSGCSGCGLETCAGCDAIDNSDPFCTPLVMACCDESTGTCHEAWGSCCGAFGFTVIGDCEDCEAQHQELQGMSNASPAYEDDVEGTDPSEDQASSVSSWVLVVAALLLLPAVPIVMRRRARRQE